MAGLEKFRSPRNGIRMIHQIEKVIGQTGKFRKHTYEEDAEEWDSGGKRKSIGA